MTHILAAALVAALTLPACTAVPGFAGGPAFSIDPGLASQARIESIGAEATPDVIDDMAEGFGQALCDDAFSA